MLFELSDIADRTLVRAPSKTVCFFDRARFSVDTCSNSCFLSLIPKACSLNLNLNNIRTTF